MSWLPSPEYADWWYGFSWKGIIAFGGIAAAATAATVVFTMIQFWSDGIRDEKTENRNRAMELQLGEANARALEAQLALEKFKAPRTLSAQQMRVFAEKMSVWARLPKADGQSAAVFPVTDSFEAASLADQIAAALGPDGAKWGINRHPVMYGKSYSVSGVGMLIGDSKRGAAVAQALVEALRDANIDAFIVPERRSGCKTPEEDDTNPWCSSVSIMVGEKPRR